MDASTLPRPSSVAPFSALDHLRDHVRPALLRLPDDKTRARWLHDEAIRLGVRRDQLAETLDDKAIRPLPARSAVVMDPRTKDEAIQLVEAECGCRQLAVMFGNAGKKYSADPWQRFSDYLVRLAKEARGS